MSSDLAARLFSIPFVIMQGLPAAMSSITSMTRALFILACLMPAFGCDSARFDTSDGWSGTVDTLSSGEIVVRNTDEPLWAPDEGWQIVEEMRYGSDTGDDAIFFGSIRSFDVDVQGRLYVLDNQSQEIHVFGPDGVWVRTVGTRGAGPGEFENAAAVDLSRTGEIWVMEMQKGQLTILDSTGNYQRTERVNTTGWDFWPYPGGFDQLGRYNALVLSSEADPTELLARFDQSFAPLDTVAFPVSPLKIERFEAVTDGGSMSTNVPFQGSFSWRFSSSGNFWTLLTRPYELAEIAPDGRVLRRVTREFELIPVTVADMQTARERLTWFTNQGGKIDESRIPRTKPVVSAFFSDDDGNLWVRRIETTPEAQGSLFDVFSAEGYFLGEVQFPFSLESNAPIVRDGLLYGTITDDVGADLIVRARIVKP